MDSVAAGVDAIQRTTDTLLRNVNGSATPNLRLTLIRHGVKRFNGLALSVSYQPERRPGNKERGVYERYWKLDFQGRDLSRLDRQGQRILVVTRRGYVSSLVIG